MASRAQSTCDRDLLAACHGHHCVGRVLRPRSRPMRDRFHLLSLPAPSVHQIVACRARINRAGDLLATGNGCVAAAATVPAIGFPLSFPLSNLSHPSLDQRPQMADTPSPWQNCLRVPRLYSFYTRSPRPDENPDFSDLFKFKNSSLYLQKCHYIVLLIKSSF